MKILFLHPYGTLGDWNSRLRGQVELMSGKCEFEILSERIELIPGIRNEFRELILKLIKEVSPDVIYVVGFMLGSFIADYFNRIVYDLGSCISRNILINERGLNVEEMLKMTDRELVGILRFSKLNQMYEKEKKVLEKAKVIIGWETKENELVKKIFGIKVFDKIRPYLTYFEDLPEPIPFSDKKSKVMAISPKWGDKEKNFGLLNNVKKEIDIEVIGHGGDIKSMEHRKLMEKLNETRVLFCPFTAGGNNIVLEGLKLGCNVITMDYYPFNTYVNEKLIVKRKSEIVVIKMALNEYFPLKKEISDKEDRINKILEVCQSIT